LLQPLSNSDAMGVVSNLRFKHAAGIVKTGQTRMTGQRLLTEACVLGIGADCTITTSPNPVVSAYLERIEHVIVLYSTLSRPMTFRQLRDTLCNCKISRFQ
jgi:hypothetical protein